jgi:hypothetical protein
MLQKIAAHIAGKGEKEDAEIVKAWATAARTASGADKA